MRASTPLPTPFGDGPFTVASARSAGVGEGRLRARDLRRPFHGVRLPGGIPDDLEARCRSKHLTMKPGQVFSHATACLLHGLDLPRRLHSVELDVAAFAPSAIPRGRGVRGHRLGAGGTRTAEARGLPVVAAEDAWCQLAASATVRELVIVGDALVRRAAPVSDLARLREAVERHRGRRGHRRLATAAELVRPGTDSVAETELRLDARAFGLPEPEVNVRILDARGRLLAIGDLAYRRSRVLMEYDGEQHRTDDAQFRRDVDRLDDLAHAGWRVIRFTKLHRGADRTARFERVRSTLVARGWAPGRAA